MKKHLLLIFSLLTICALQAQESFELLRDSDSLIVDVETLGDYPDIKIDGTISNITNGRQSYSWKREIIFLTDQLATAVCDPNACYEPQIGEAPNPAALMPSDTGQWQMHFYPYFYEETPIPYGKPLPGYVDFRITVFNFINPDDSLTMDYHFAAMDMTSSREEVIISPYKVYPNPAVDLVKITPAQNINRVELFALNGQQIKTYDRIFSTGNIDMTGLESGMYVLKVYNREDQVSFMKIMKQ
ncbi:MAG: T9SS type A sorting domain-containing protein [Bacteroidota bacterium]